MAPKKKGGKKEVDDWENELGETPDPIAQATEDAKAAESTQDGDADAESVGGGLLAALRKNKDKRKKKGKIDNDFVEGEDPNGVAPIPNGGLDAKGPEEANIEEEDVFAGSGGKKGKAGKKEQKPTTVEDEDDEDEGGSMKSKKEKEKEKKEREKQRKKEQVGLCHIFDVIGFLTLWLGRKEKGNWSSYRSTPSRSAEAYR